MAWASKNFLHGGAIQAKHAIQPGHIGVSAFAVSVPYKRRPGSDPSSKLLISLSLYKGSRTTLSPCCGHSVGKKWNDSH
jgi:hypothetical protein